jgi:hypothetical protein
MMVTQLAKEAGEPLIVQLACLLHDAEEAYLGDIVKPLGDFFKAECPGYQEIKEAWSNMIMKKCGIKADSFIHETVKKYDNAHVDMELYHYQAVMSGDISVYAKYFCHHSAAVASGMWLSLVNILISRMRLLEINKAFMEELQW